MDAAAVDEQAAEAALAVKVCRAGSPAVESGERLAAGGPCSVPAPVSPDEVADLRKL